ncbi:MAG: hypothetical protein LKCHEGNO_00484 [Burkholderiaceae bacterium]|nr:hypothetical protein [Burkholderiaceae bacterium]
MNPPAPTDAGQSDREFQLSLIQAIHEASPDAILVVDDRGRIASHNRRFIDMMCIPNDALRGLQPGTAIGQHDDLILAASVAAVKDGAALQARVLELYANPELEDHCEVEMKDGRMIERHSTALRGPDGQYFGRVWFFRDITHQKRIEAALHELARHDPLTGVANRRYFFEQAQHEFARARRHRTPLSITGIDIDHFKNVNDRHGHDGGDAVLRSFCGVAQRLIREGELFARLGGEEFAVLLPDTPIDGASRFAQRLRRAAAEAPLALDGERTVRCTISVGVTALREADAAVEDCLRRADAALYRAKQSGRNRVEVEA